jgi:predicted DNA-binding antitoxin AbrB/MazE fold protein
MEEIEVVYEKDIFKPLGDIDLQDGTKAVVIVRPKGIADVLEKFSKKVDRDVLKEFLEERGVNSC